MLLRPKRAGSCCGSRLTLCLPALSGAAAENMLGSLLCLPGSGSVLLDPYGSTISETTSEAWSVEVLPSDSGTKARFMLPSDSSFSFAIVSDVCLHAYLCSFDSVGVGTPGVLARHSIPKLCACICHHICGHLPCLSGQICVC